ncbi:MAG TPA: exodeoxyribonuclease VII large subunit [Terriglobales bacterium]|jgi:exodeoxyribonuclease VII large subunit|nr:exodeoxyribonuclease VII large subunit [Terriglobales bacterium]
MSGTEQLGLVFQAQPRKIYPVRELVAALRTQLERTFTDVFVQGEISNYRPADSGHLYFTLKDGSSQLRVVMWRTQARLLKFRPENGLQVIARGRVTVYDERGDLQFQAEYLEPQGAGALQIAFEQLKAKLAAEGLFDTARKKPVPALPRRIGLVTSPRGAAVQDILNILRRRHESVGVLIYPAQVQGDVAPGEVSRGVRYFNRHGHVDVIIVARGGGSFEDLFAFNDEGLARTIAASGIPIISAVGHETDFTICDFVADLRAPTPSAAAEMVIRSKHELSEKLQALYKRATHAMNYRLLRANNALSSLVQHAVFARMQDSIARRQQRVDDLVFRLAQSQSRILKSQFRRIDALESQLRRHDLRVRTGLMRRQLESRTTELNATISRLLTARRSELDRLTASLRAAPESILLRRRSRWERVHSSLEALSPKAILARGYALVFDAEGRLVKHASQVKSGDRVRTQLGQGEFTARVDRVKREESG